MSKIEMTCRFAANISLKILVSDLGRSNEAECNLEGQMIGISRRARLKRVAISAARKHFGCNLIQMAKQIRGDEHL